MQKSEEAVVSEFAGVRTGKASPALVENINIEAYEGSSMRLKELAAITTPEMRTLVIQPWDASTTAAIEKGIQAANLGLNPSVDGKVIRINLPDLSKERRQEMVKATRKLAEDGRVSIRHIRREALESLMQKKEQSMLSFQKKNCLNEEKNGNQKKLTSETEHFGNMHKLLVLLI